MQSMTRELPQRLRPKLISFDVFGTLISVRESSYGAFEGILGNVGAERVDVKAFWEYWEHRNIVHYWEPYRTYREICELSLEESFAHFGLTGDGHLIERYFESFPPLPSLRGRGAHLGSTVAPPPAGRRVQYR